MGIAPAPTTDESGKIRGTEYNDFTNFPLARHSLEPDVDLLAHARGKVVLHRGAREAEQSGPMQRRLRAWINNGLEAHLDGLNWQGSYSEYGINTVFLENYWNTGSPQPQERNFDNFVVSTERIGC